MLKKLLHLLLGCREGKKVWSGPVSVVAKKNHAPLLLRGSWLVLTCDECGEPFIKKQLAKDFQESA